MLNVAITNSPLESYNGRIKDDFTERSYFNLVPAFKKFERLVEFESVKEATFVTTPSVPVSDETKAKNLLKLFPDKLVKINENIFKVNGKKEKTSYMVDLMKSVCTCIKFFDKGSCKHLVACALLADKPVLDLPLNNKFNVRYRQRKKSKNNPFHDSDDDISFEEESTASLQPTAPIQVNLQISPSISPPKVLAKTQVDIESTQRITRSKTNLVKPVSKVVKQKPAKYTTLDGVIVKVKRGRPAKIKKALHID